MEDVIIIGGGFAGLSAALQLGRARRRVVVLDTGLPRNRFAAHAHGVLGHDGRPPREILALGLEQLGTYPSVRVVGQGAVSVSGEIDAFAVTLDDDTTLHARRLILAYGMADELPDIPGAAECWGRTLVHCPYCHGFELADKRLGGLMPADRLMHGGVLYREWSRDLTMFTDGGEPAAEDRAKLADLGVKLNTAKVVGLEHNDGNLTAVVTSAGSVALDALFSPPPVRFTSPIGEALGCRIEAGFLGPYLAVDEGQRTSVAGVHAAGDISRAMHNVTFAIAGGVMAATFAHQSLIV